MSYVLGIDLGTSSIKSILLDTHTSNTWTSQVEYQYSIPQQGYAEQHVSEWWEAMKQVIYLVCEKAEVAKNKVEAISFSGQMHGVVALDKYYEPVCPAIIWCDQRSANIVDKYSTPEYLNLFRENTSNRLQTGFALASLIWLKKHDMPTFNNIYKICCPKDYLVYKLTGHLATEQSDASSTLLFDVKNACWSKTIQETFGLSGDLLPEVFLPTDFAGFVRPEVAECMGLSKKCKVYFGGSDQVMQAIGNGIISPGDVSVTIGTGGQILSVLDKPFKNENLESNIFNFVNPNSWYFLGATLSAGQSLRWLRNKLLPDMSYKEIDLAAESKPCGSGGLIFLPYLVGTRSPVSDAKASGMFLGLTIDTDKGSLIRSVLEGVTFSLKDNLQILEGVLGEIDTIIASGGGAQSNLWLQIQSDIFNKNIVRSEMSEQAALGAAITAAVGCGCYSSITEAAKTLVKYSDDVIKPIKANVPLYQEIYAVYSRLYESNKDNMHMLRNIKL